MQPDPSRELAIAECPAADAAADATWGGAYDPPTGVGVTGFASASPRLGLLPGAPASTSMEGLSASASRGQDSAYPASI